jgi:hypothetical protein
LATALTLAALIQLAVGLPLTPGTWWEYRELAREKVGPVWSATELQTRISVQGSPSRPYLHQEGGLDPVSGRVEIGADWIRLPPWTGEDPLPWPLKVGAQGPAADVGLAGWSVETEEPVSVPAGNYMAVKCTLATPSLESTLWIVPGLGVIRETHGVPGLPPEIERVLLRWSGTPPPPEERDQRPDPSRSR